MTEGFGLLNVLAITTFAWIAYIVGFVWFAFIMFVIFIDSHVKSGLIEMKKRAQESDRKMEKRMGL